MQSGPVRPAATRLPTSSSGRSRRLPRLFLVWPVWRAFFPLEIWGNEGWNAYHADQAMRGTGLYPPPDGLIANNYPPLSYYLIGWLGRLVRRSALCRAGALAAGDAGHRCGRRCRGAAIRRIARRPLLAGFWFVATLARFFEFYVGMNEPQLLGLAVMAAGFAWFFKRHARGPPGRARRAGDGAGRLHQAQLHHAAAGRADLARARQPAAGAARRAGRRRGRRTGACDLRLGVRALFHRRHADAAHLSSGAWALHARPAAIHSARDGAVGDLGLARTAQQAGAPHRAADRHRAAALPHPEVRRGRRRERAVRADLRNRGRHRACL